MKQQSVGIVLCALLFTTFGHELLNRHHISTSTTQNPTGRTLPRRPISTTVRTTPKPSDNCEIICSYPIRLQENLTISFNASAGLAGVYNSSADIALIIDVNASVVAIINGTASTAIAINYVTQVGVVVSGTWWSGQNFTAYFQSLTTLQYLFEQNGETFNSTSVSLTIEQEIQIALSSFSGGQYNISANNALAILIEYSVSISSSLRLILQVVISESFSAHITLRILVERIRGLANVITNIRGGIEVLLEHEIKISFQIILRAKSSLQIATYIWTLLISADFDNIFRNNTDPFEIVTAIASLGGNSTEGVSGLLTILGRTLGVIEGKVTVEAYVEVLIEFYANRDGVSFIELKTQINEVINLVYSLHLQGRFKTVLLVLESIRSGTFVVEGVNLSSIIQLFVRTNSTGLINIITILYQLRYRINFTQSVGQLLFALISLLSIRGGLKIVLLFIPNLNIGNIDPNSDNVIIIILQNYSVKELQAALKNPGAFLTQLRIIGGIISAFRSALVQIRSSVTIDAILQYEGRAILEYLIRIVVRWRSGGSTVVESSTAVIGGSTEWSTGYEYNITGGYSTWVYNYTEWITQTAISSSPPKPHGSHEDHGSHESKG